MKSQLHDMSRRGFLVFSSAAVSLLSPMRKLLNPGDEGDPALSPGSAGSRSANPLARPTSQVFSLTGGSTGTGFIVCSQWHLNSSIPTSSIGLTVSTSPTMASPTRFAQQYVSRTDGILRQVTTGLRPNTRYYCRLTHGPFETMFGPQFEAWTRPEGTGPYRMDIILGSCLGNTLQIDGERKSQIALHDAVTNVPSRSVHMNLGDWGYWGQDLESTDPADYPQDLKQYIKTNAKYGYLREILHSTNLEGVCISDHELELNGDGEGIFGSGHSKRELVAFQRLFPIADPAYGDVRSPRLHRGYYTQLAPHVRLVVSDFRSPERENPTNTAKQMWGAAQEDWLFNDAFEVDDDQIVLFVNETSWWRQSGGYRATDKPAAYGAAQDRFVARIHATGDYSDKTPLTGRFVWLGGDRHFCGYLSAEQSPDNFPQFIGSGWHKYAVKLQNGEHMDWITPTPASSESYDTFPVAQYMHLVLSYEETTGVLTLSGQARYAQTHRILPGVRTQTGRNTLTAETGTTFKDSDVGRVITGRYIPVPRRHTDPPTTITEVAADGRSAKMSRRARRGDSHLATIMLDPSDWQMADLPETPTELTFQVG